MLRLYKKPLNYFNNRTNPQVCADNKYDTFTTDETVSVNVDVDGSGMGAPQRITDIFIKSKGVDTVSVSGIGLTISDVDNPLTNDSGEEVSPVVDGFQNILSSGINREEDAMTFTFADKSGETAQIHELLVLDEIFRLDGNGIFIDPLFTFIDSGITQTSATGRLSYAPALNNERDKWQVDLRIRFSKFANGRDIRSKLDELISFMRAEKTFACAIEPNRYPDMMFPLAIFPEKERQIRYIVRRKDVGRDLRIRIREA